jgi:two-component system, chemotaxis family, protein-glutamate methylesterase/glutaminase
VKKKKRKAAEYKAVVIGASAGGIKAVKDLLRKLNPDFKLPVIVVVHISPHSENYWVKILNKECKMAVKEADEKERILKGTVYIAPPGYHLLIEKNQTFTLTSDERVNYSRPSIDVLFETAADAYGEHLIGIVLTGANADGAEGLRKIKDAGGLAIVQEPDTAEVDVMPLAAINAANPKYILPLSLISAVLNDLNNDNNP